MNDKQIDVFLSKLEKQYSNDLNLIEQFEIGYFDTSYLEHVYVKWQLKEKNLTRKCNYLMMLALSSPTWLVIGFIGTHIQSSFFTAFIYLFPISISITIIGIFQLYHQHGGLKQYKTIGKTIRQELLQRTHSIHI